MDPAGLAILDHCCSLNGGFVPPDGQFKFAHSACAGHAFLIRMRWFRELARIIHGFWKSCEELASFAKRFQTDCQMLKFVQAATTAVADLVIERGKNAFFGKHLCVGLL